MAQIRIDKNLRHISCLICLLPTLCTFAVQTWFKVELSGWKE